MAENELAEVVLQHVNEMRKAGGFPGEQALNRLAAQIAKVFKGRKDEVALLRLSPDGKVLRFIFPVRLSKVGAIPISTENSLAAKTAREGEGEIVNDFLLFRHATVFESVNLSESERASPIHKIMSVPMMADGKVVGVIQVSRKGRMTEPIGEDFTPQDLFNLTAAGKILGAYFSTVPAEPPKPTPVGSR
jgi:GAF domain-containing protein